MPLQSLCVLADIRFATGLLTVFVCATVSADAPNWPGRMGHLVTEGVEVQGVAVRLDAPKVDPRLSAEERVAAQKNLAGGAGWARFSRNSVVAPVKIELSYLKSADEVRVGHRIHVSYVVHAGIETLKDSEFLSGLFGGPSSSGEEKESQADEKERFHSERLDDRELSQLGIQPEEDTDYGWLEFLLLKRVELRGLIRSERVEAEDYFAISWELDERFTDRVPPAERIRNEWVRLDRASGGEQLRSQPSSYSGAAGYLIVSSVEGMDDACLVEAEVVMNEPEDWFSGSSLLRSKLPLILQESARRFRRGLK